MLPPMTEIPSSWSYCKIGGVKFINGRLFGKSKVNKPFSSPFASKKKLPS